MWRRIYARVYPGEYHDFLVQGKYRDHRLFIAVERIAAIGKGPNEGGFCWSVIMFLFIIKVSGTNFQTPRMASFSIV